MYIDHSVAHTDGKRAWVCPQDGTTNHTAKKNKKKKVSENVVSYRGYEFPGDEKCLMHVGGPRFGEQNCWLLSLATRKETKRLQELRLVCAVTTFRVHTHTLYYTHTRTLTHIRTHTPI